MDIKDKVFRVKESFKNGPRQIIGYDDVGKIIIAKNPYQLRPGFAKVEKYEERDRCYIAHMRNVVYDYYEGILPDELHRVFEKMGFVMEYYEPINTLNTFWVYAKLDTGELITVETWEETKYNSIQVYIPIDKKVFIGLMSGDGLGFHHGNGHVCCFNALHCWAEAPIHAILDNSSKSRNWQGETPSLYHYGSPQDMGPKDFAETAKKIFKFNDDIDGLFNMKTDKAVEKYLSHA